MVLGNQETGEAKQPRSQEQSGKKVYGAVRRLRRGIKSGSREQRKLNRDRGATQKILREQGYRKKEFREH